MLGNTIRTNPSLQGVWVMAEMSDVRFNGGHCYMELLEKDSQGRTAAKVRAMIWAGTLRQIRGKFFAATGSDIASGMKVLVRGSATHHALYGLSFTISDINPEFSLGDMERIRREILERLHREGLDGYNKSLQFPMTPQRIAVISAAGAAGYGDFVNQIESVPERFAIYPMLFGAVMQGDRTVPTVLDALERVENAVDFWDCVVIIRGGGATTDLNGFDNYELARRVATFPIPVVVGIGHERDRTVLDELACVRCKTPTAVAAFIIDTLRQSLAMSVDLVRRIAKYSSDALRGESLRLSNLEQAIPVAADRRMMSARMKLQQAASGVERAVASRFSAENTRVVRLSSRVENAAKGALSDASHRVERLGDMLRLLSPENTLRRGYSITRIAGHALRDTKNVRQGDVIETVLADGTLYSTVRATSETKENDRK